MSDEPQPESGLTPPSSGPSDHLLPPREKGTGAHASSEFVARSSVLPGEPPSTLVGEGTGVRGERHFNTHLTRADKSHRKRERRNRGFAKSMRRNPTEAERQMWLLLKDRRLADYKFRRQVPIGPYIADFVCYSARLIIELDGSQHGKDTTDAARDAWLKAKGFRVLRIWNSQLTNDGEAVVDAVWHNLQELQHG